MDSGTLRSGGPEGPETYWRRRVIGLCVVIAVVALLAWACSGLSGGGDDGKQNAAQVAPSGSASGYSPTPSASPMATTSASGSPSASPTPTASSSATPQVTVTVTKRAKRHGPARAGDACAPRDIVVTLTADHRVYGSGDDPAFTLSVVNTGKITCTLDVGPSALPIVIRSGHDRIWSSGDCAHGGRKVERLKRGVPYLTRTTWHRTRSFTDCRAGHLSARRGTYVVEAGRAHLHSAKVVFSLH